MAGCGAGADRDGDGIGRRHRECHGSTERFVNGSFELLHTVLGRLFAGRLLGRRRLWTNTEPTTEVWANGFLGAIGGRHPDRRTQRIGPIDLGPDGRRVTPGQVLQWSVAYRLRSAG
ncbi:MAG: hypothetical protein R2704_17430 [Microthrixaceae bacterium]